MNRPISVLFLCTHNSARSILAEALLNHLGGSRFIGHSAGSTPRSNGQPNPLALQALQQAGIAVDGLRSKSWNEFIGAAAPPLDLVITVCGNAEQACPLFPGAPATAHWGYDDPSAGDGDEASKRAAFATTLSLLRQRLQALVHLPEAALAPGALQQAARSLATT